jgi:hypothetical protein
MNPLSSKRMVLHSLLLACVQLNEHFQNRFTIQTLLSDSLITRYDAIVCIFSHAFFSKVSVSDHSFSQHGIRYNISVSGKV